MTRRVARSALKPRPAPPRRKSGKAWRLAMIASATVLGGLLVALFAADRILGRPARLAEQAEQAARIRDWEAAARAWHEHNEYGSAHPISLLAEARAWLAIGHAARAERALDRAIAADRVPPEPYLLLLEMLRVEGRTIEAQDLGWRAYESVPETSRRLVLKALTLALLADAPEAVARGTLSRWSAVDPDDFEARIALLRRMAANPRPDDPRLSARIAEIRAILDRHPDSISAREALILALAESGDPEQGQAVLEAWPEASRDVRFDRIKGRWVLENDRKPAAAIPLFRQTLGRLPHDWKTRNRLARALNATGQEAKAQQEARAVERLREILDPGALGRRLDADLAKLDEPKSRLDLADLCESVGLDRLAEAWRRDVGIPPSPSAR